MPSERKEGGCPEKRMGHITAYAVAVVSLLAGAAVVHNLYKPSLVLPGVSPPSAGGAESNQNQPITTQAQQPQASK